MKRGLVVLCLAGLLFAIPGTEARAADAGVFRGSYQRTRQTPDVDEWTFSQIDFDGTLTAGRKTYIGAFYIVSGLIGREFPDEDCGFSCVDDPGFFLSSSPGIDAFSWAIIRGTTNGQSLKGNCGGKQSNSYGTGPLGATATRRFHFVCGISVDGSNFKPVVIDGRAGEVGALDSAHARRFVGAYTAAAP